MAALDDILGGGSGYAGIRKSLQVSPPAIDPSMPGAPNTVGSQPATQPQKAPRTSQPQTPGTHATKVAGKPGEAPQPQMSYVEMFKMLNPERPETAEERAKREKREKGEAALAAVGDSISALSNLWFTSQYAPNAYDPSKGMSATTKDKWDKLRQVREANRRAYSDGYMRALTMDEAKDREDRNWRHTIEREKIADMATGWLAGQAARDFTATDEKMLSHFDIENSEEFKTTKYFCKTNFDMKKIKDEESHYVDLPKIYAFKDEREKEIMLNRNFKRVNQEVDEIIRVLAGKRITYAGQYYSQHVFSAALTQTEWERIED